MCFVFSQANKKEENLNTVQNSSNITIPNTLQLYVDESFESLLNSDMFKRTHEVKHIKIDSNHWTQLNANNTSDQINLSLMGSQRVVERYRCSSLSDQSLRIGKLRFTDMLYVTQDSIRPILSEITSSFYPEAIIQRLYHNISPPTGSILIGSQGSGKSQILDMLQEKFQFDASFLLHVVNIDCSMMKGKDASRIISYLSDQFHRALKCSPTLLTIDNIHDICPDYSNDDSNAPVSYSSSQDSAALVSLQLERLLREVYQRNVSSHTVAYNYLQRYIRSKVDNQVTSTAAASSSSRVTSYDKSSDEINYIIAIALKDVIYVLATTNTASSISSSILSHHGLRRYYNIQSLKPKFRIEALQLYLANYHIDVSHLLIPQTANDGHCLEFNRLTEGFVLKDLENLSREIAVTYLSQQAGPEANPSQLISWTTILSIAGNYIDLSSSAMNLTHKPFTGRESSYMTWDNIGGLQQAKEATREVIYFPSLFRRLYSQSHIRLPRGILLYGPSGVGKVRSFV